MKRILAALAAAALCTAPPAAAQTLEQARDLYHQNRLDESLPVFQALARANPADGDLRAWVAENQRRLGQNGAALELARQVLADHACHAMAHDVIASVYAYGVTDAEGAADSAWAHARRAVECDPDDGSAWLTYWMQGLLRRDPEAEARATRRVAETGFIPEPVLELARWMLRASPPDALLLANGDWDYFPLSVVQLAEGVRPDVTVVLRPTLELPWYVRRIAERTGAPLPPEMQGLDDDGWLTDDAGEPMLGSAAASFWAAEWLEGRSARPLVIASTADVDLVMGAAWPRWDGPVYTLRPRDEAPFGGEATMHADAFDVLLPLLDAARLDGPLVHASDRSPVRRNGVHPAEYVVWQLFGYGSIRVAERRMEDARRALAQIEGLTAAGHVDGVYAEMGPLLREMIASAAESR